MSTLSPDLRRMVNRMRRRYAGKNGVISSGLFDIPKFEMGIVHHLRLRKRKGAAERRAILKTSSPETER